MSIQPPAGSGNLSQDDKLWTAIAYGGSLLCCFVPSLVIFLIKKDQSNFIKLHCLQSIGLFLVYLALNLVLSVIGNIPVINIMASLLFVGVYLTYVVYSLYLVIQTAQGNDVDVPYIGDFVRANLM